MAPKILFDSNYQLFKTKSSVQEKRDTLYTAYLLVWATVAQSAQCLTTGWMTAVGSQAVGKGFSSTVLRPE
jgi:hypothetical protein